MYTTRKFVIVTYADITDEMIANALESSRDTLRKTLDGTKALLKFDGDTPSCFDGMTLYSYNEIITECKKNTWTDGPEE